MRLQFAGTALQQVLNREGAIQVDADHAILLAIGVGVVYGLAGSFGS